MKRSELYCTVFDNPYLTLLPISAQNINISKEERSYSIFFNFLKDVFAMVKTSKPNKIDMEMI